MKRDRLNFMLLKLLTALVFIAVPFTVAAQSKKDRDQAKKFKDQGAKAYAQRNYREAADAYGKALLLVPTDADGHYRKGYAHFSLQENDPAVNEFTTALNQGYKPLDIYRVRHFIYFGQKNYDAAMTDIQKGLLLAPTDINFLTAIGSIYLERKSYAEALAAFQRASQVAPNDADIFYNMARVHNATGNAAGQETAADAALTKGTRFPGEAHFLLGDARQKLRKPTGAIESYQRAIHSKPELYQAYRNLAEVYRSEGRFNDAINISKQALKIFANDGNIYTELSLFYSLDGRPEDAVQAAKAGIQILPNQHVAYTNLCRAYNETKSYDMAVSACNGALRLQPDDGETYFYLGNAYVGQGKSTEATRFYTKAVTGLVTYTQKNPGLSDGWYLLGNAYFADKQYDKAVEAYLKCLDLSPRFLKARVNLGISYTRRKNKPAALEQYNLLLPADAALAARLKAEIDRM